MKHGIQIKLPSFLLALAIVLSLCGCAVNPQELLNQLDLPQMSGKGKESEGAAVRMIPTIWTRLSMLKQRKGKTL